MPIVNNLYNPALLGECQKHKGHGWLNCQLCAIKKDEKRRKELEDSFIKPTTMENNFDFDKAIQGSPIYCNGERIYVCYYPNETLFREAGNSWDKHGNPVITYPSVGSLSTNPPVKKVKKTVWVSIATGYDTLTSTNPNTKEYCDNHKWRDGFKSIGTYPIEIEVEEPIYQTN